ncbi:hypothetical protein [Spongiactinospora sp. TRM90649]|uniref:hypothetical protein n=1 Tax=Spongiactinospora sp. TRM90649 TaxID=3031114 RepID=UPI0023F657BD|nr:hypothetical protein [Spongiactinospora sp. TRM90649]MDF5756618.1 hypothetical protein [Spongiactinospora sp. TRM90649]
MADHPAATAATGPDDAPPPSPGDADVRAGSVCGFWLAPAHRHCRVREAVRRYPIGWRCAAHTPRTMAGLAPSPPAAPYTLPPAWTLHPVTVPIGHPLSGRCVRCGWPHERYGPCGTPHCLDCAAALRAEDAIDRPASG